MVMNAHGDPQKQKSQAEQCLAQGAKVVILDPLDDGSVAAITISRSVAGRRSSTTTASSSAARRPLRVVRHTAVGGLQGTGLVAGLKAKGMFEEAGRRRAQRRHHRQQREALQAGLRRDPEPAVQVRHVQEGPAADQWRTGTTSKARTIFDQMLAQTGTRSTACWRRTTGSQAPSSRAQGPRAEADPADRPGRDARACSSSSPAGRRGPSTSRAGSRPRPPQAAINIINGKPEDERKVSGTPSILLDPRRGSRSGTTSSSSRTAS